MIKKFVFYIASKMGSGCSSRKMNLVLANRGLKIVSQLNKYDINKKKKDYQFILFERYALDEKCTYKKTKGYIKLTTMCSNF